MESRRRLSPGRVRAARLLAVATDLLQIVVFPAFIGGVASPWNNALDLLVAALETWLVGWHWAFLPSFVAELVPGLDLVPTWTAAVFFATRGRKTVAPGTERSGAIDTEVVASSRGGRSATGGWELSRPEPRPAPPADRPGPPAVES